MNTLPGCGTRDLSQPEGRWQRRKLTVEALLELLRAMAMVRFSRFERWRDSLGWDDCEIEEDRGQNDATARLLAVHVERAAARLTLPVKCLPRAIALGAMLRRRGIAHHIVIAARSSKKREEGDPLHAWAERSGKTLIGDQPGPWIEMFRSGRSTG